MDEWFQDLIEEIIWRALKDFYEWLAGVAETEVDTKLNSLAVGDEMGSSPKVTVLETTATTVTFLIRGRIKVFGKSLQPFMRIEAVVGKDIDLTSGDTPIDIVDWRTVIGDIDISKKDVFTASLAFGYDKGSWLGQGAFKVIPGGFGLDVTLGGLNDRGLMIGLDLDLPTAIPLGSTGLGLIGMGGDFAYNFVPRLEKAGVIVADPTAEDYIRWARNHEVDRWVAGSIDETAVGIGVRTDLATIFDNGWSLKLVPIGLAVLTPGPIFVLGGKGILLKTDSAKIEGYLAVDIASGSLALGLGVTVKMPKSGKLVDANGTLDALFSFKDPSIWYVNFGTDKKPITAKVMNNLWNAELFLMLNNNRVFFGAGLSLGGEWKWWIITLTARVGARVGLLVGWNPQELGGYFEIWGELGLKVWKFGFKLSGAARVIGHVPDPTQLDFEFRYKLDLPWPIPDISGKATFSYTDDEPIGPPLRSPLLSGSSTAGGTTSSDDLTMGGLHEITGRQWELDSGAIWPDASIVVPFAVRSTDNTNLVAGPDIGGYVQGGYDVNHTLTKLELHDLVNNSLVPEVGAVWAAGPGGDTARLHVLGRDPFSWLIPHTDTINGASETPGSFKLQKFGLGPEETFSTDRRFGQLIVAPAGDADLLNAFQPALWTRVMQCESFELRWERVTGQPIDVDPIVIYLVGLDPEHSDQLGVGSTITMETSEGPVSGTLVRNLYGGVGLYAVVINPSAATSTLTVHSASKIPLLVYGVAGLEKKKIKNLSTSKTVLKPGRYRLDIQGSSTATHPSGNPDLPDSTPVSWQDSQVFEVDYPESLRPYISGATLADERLFGPTTSWNPTMHGVGFPHYRGYRPVVRFVVPYMDDIFPNLDMSLRYDNNTSLTQSLTPAANPAGTSSLPSKAKIWVAAAGGSVGADEEVVLTDTVSNGGPVSVRLGFTHPTEGHVKLDEWSAYVSRYFDFDSHLSWAADCITVVYDSAGRHTATCCPSIPRTVVPLPGIDWARRAFERAIEMVRGVVDWFSPARMRPPALEVVDITPIEPFPDELTTVPVTWRLGSQLTQHLDVLHPDSGTDYTRFAHASGVRFNTGGADPLEGLGTTVSDTTIEALLDNTGRPLALWLRTPEPVDWRRVSAMLRIKHISPESGCPHDHAERHPLDLDIGVLPSPDASSAFLVGVFGGTPTRLPRGEYELTLTFDPDTTGIPPLRPSPTLSAGPEIVTHAFIQPSGKDWPLPSTGVTIPAGVLQHLELMELIDPDEIWELADHLRPWDPDPLPGRFEPLEGDEPG